MSATSERGRGNKMIAIKDFKMPKACRFCPIWQIDTTDEVSPIYCCLADDWLDCDTLDTHRPNSCPLMEVPYAESQF